MQQPLISVYLSSHTAPHRLNGLQLAISPTIQSAEARCSVLLRLLVYCASELPVVDLAQHCTILHNFHAILCYLSHVYKRGTERTEKLSGLAVRDYITTYKPYYNTI